MEYNIYFLTHIATEDQYLLKSSTFVLIHL